MSQQPTMRIAMPKPRRATLATMIVLAVLGIANALLMNWGGFSGAFEWLAVLPGTLPLQVFRLVTAIALTSPSSYGHLLFSLFFSSFIVSMFIIMNSVKLSVYARRIEINIMKYVGATDFFIQLPYFIEGMMNGLIAGILSFVIELYLYNAVLSPILSDLLPSLVFTDMLSFWVPFFLVGGVLIGIIGSVYPVKKYLKV